MIKSILFTAMVISFIACNPKTEKQKEKERERFPSEETGGPCTFDTTIKPIIVQRIVPMDSTALRIVFQIPYGVDSFDHTLNIQQYEKEFNALAADIKIADTFQFMELRTIGGSCAGKPQIYMKKFEGYKY